MPLSEVKLTDSLLKFIPQNKSITQEDLNYLLPNEVFSESIPQGQGALEKCQKL